MRPRRKRVGLLVPSTNSAAEPELARHLPAEVTVHTARMRFTPEGGPAAMLDTYLPEAVADLATLQPDVVLFACTTAGAMRGSAYEVAMLREIEQQTGAKALSVMAEAVEALRRLGARRIGLLTPYPEEGTRAVAAALVAAGFEVPVAKGLQIAGVRPPELTPDDLIAFGREALAGVEVDAVFISCTDLFTLDALDQFEAAFGKPVITSLSAGLAAVERALGASAHDTKTAVS
ncbi:MAG: aspartate/glutamate racemase family protein [Chloroflexota bacterium]|nr:aspartate/glutamate racemase family protein [Dehalococcoidia bacterium]MDW8252576.1 aspartate/glutamate racemase family protein [Chloroflexota bacterium]